MYRRPRALIGHLHLIKKRKHLPLLGRSKRSAGSDYASGRLTGMNRQAHPGQNKCRSGSHCRARHSASAGVINLRSTVESPVALQLRCGVLQAQAGQRGCVYRCRARALKPGCPGASAAADSLLVSPARTYRWGLDVAGGAHYAQASAWLSNSVFTADTRARRIRKRNGSAFLRSVCMPRCR